MVIEITELENSNFEGRCSIKVGNNPGELINNVVELLGSRFEKGGQKVLEQVLKKLQSYNLLSTELIRYYLLSEKLGSHKNAMGLLYSNYGKHQVKEEMRKLFRFMKEKGITKEIKSQYYRRLLNWNGNLKRFLISRHIHQFKI